MTSTELVILLNLTPTSVAPVVCGVHRRACRRAARRRGGWKDGAGRSLLLLRFLRANLAEVRGVLGDVDRSLDAVEQGEAAAQLEELGRAGAFDGAVDQLGAVGLRRFDQQVGLGVLLALVE